MWCGPLTYFLIPKRKASPSFPLFFVVVIIQQYVTKFQLLHLSNTSSLKCYATVMLLFPDLLKFDFTLHYYPVHFLTYNFCSLLSNYSYITVALFYSMNFIVLCIDIKKSTEIRINQFYFE